MRFMMKFMLFSVLQSRKRFFNTISVIYELLTSKLILNTIPPLLELEPTNRCNLRCYSCPTGLKRLVRPIGDMSFKEYKRLIDEIGNKILVLVLYLHGEPLLNKDIYKMISYSHKIGIFTVLSTNGNYLDAKKLVKSGLQYFTICLDGASQQSYRKYRVGGDFNKVVKNINEIMDLKRSLRSKTPFVDVHFIVNRYNEHEINAIKNLSKKLGVDNLTLKKFVPPPFVVQSENPSKFKDILSFIPENVKYQYKLKFNENLSSLCNRSWISSVITWDGRMIPCCYDVNATHCFGNVFDKNFQEVWNSNEMIAFRKNMLESKSRIALCQRCSGSTNQFESEYIKL